MNETKITLTADDGSTEDFFIVDTTKVNDIDYILVTGSPASDAEDADYYILKDLSAPEDADALYEFVEDDTEWDAVAGIFEQLLDSEE